MIRQNTERGAVVIGSNVYTNIAGVAASNCFGVKGVRVQFHEDDTISIDLHIMVDHGVNLAAVGASIISEVRYVVHKCTGTQVRAVNVYIDSMMIG